MVGPTIRLVAETKRGSAKRGSVRPGPTSANTGVGAIAVGMPLPVGKVRISASGKLGMIPITAPFEFVSVHVVKAPGIGGVAPNFSRSGTGHAGGRAIVGLTDVGIGVGQGGS